MRTRKSRRFMEGFKLLYRNASRGMGRTIKCRRSRRSQPANCRESLPPPRSWCAPEDRKSTRLNSSHDQISYAVFCLKKKKKKKKNTHNMPLTHNVTRVTH